MKSPGTSLFPAEAALCAFSSVNSSWTPGAASFSGTGKRSTWSPRRSTSSSSCSSASRGGLQAADPRPPVARHLRLGIDPDQPRHGSPRRPRRRREASPVRADGLRARLRVRRRRGRGPHGGRAEARASGSSRRTGRSFSARARTYSAGTRTRRSGSTRPRRRAAMRESSWPASGRHWRTWAAATARIMGASGSRSRSRSGTATRSGSDERC